MAPQHDAISIKRSALQEDESRLALALSAIRTSLNELAPVSWLPTEILEEIFAICVSWLYGNQKPKHRLAWTQVNRVWRQVSLNSARLWRCIDLCDSRLASEFLVRSKAAPISIISASPLKLCTDDLHIHAERLQSIDVFLFPDDMLELFSNIGSNLSTLTNLSLKIPPVSSSLALDIPIPNVRRLVLDSVAVQWDMCTNLTHFSLRGLTPDLCPTLTQLHDIFQRSPFLEQIRLENIHPAKPITAGRPRILHLSSLRDMVISAKACVVSSILSDLSFPTQARLHINCSLFRGLQTLFPTGFPHSQSHLQFSSPDSSPNSLSAFPFPVSPTISTTTALRFARHAVHLLRPTAPPWCEAPVSALISITSSSCVSMPILTSIHAIIPLTDITALELSTGVLLDMPIQALTKLLLATANLTALRIAFNNMGELLSALTASSPSLSPSTSPYSSPPASPPVSPPRTPAASPPPPPSSFPPLPLSLHPAPLCPNLHTISFSKPGDLWWHFGEHWLPSITACAAARALFGVPLGRIGFVRCHGISWETLGKLREVVPEIVIEEEFTPAR